jgi:CRISPR/Cas system CSM-associated protein Csm3 (group 7 of RAMP superfamily)
MAEPDLNPYNFVPLPDDVRREAFPGLDRLKREHLSGILSCELEALTPLFTADHQKANPVPDHGPAFPFLRNAGGEPILQGTTIRGMIRAVYEAAFPSCLPLVATRGISRKKGKPVEYEMTLPDAVVHCNDPAKLCPACRLFGVIQGDEVHAQGRVSFSDAVLTSGALEPGRVHLRELSSPKPHHYDIYSRTGVKGGEIRGRKLFYHHDPAARPVLQPASREWSERSNAMEEVAPAGATFSFRIHFLNLAPDELRQLMGCLVLDRGHAHKIGMAKPLGYGSCRIHVKAKADESRCWMGGDRYRSWRGTEIPVVPQPWTPAPQSLECLLLFPGGRVGITGYRSLHAYHEIGIDEQGRYAGKRVSLEQLFPPPMATERPLRLRRFKKGDSAKVRVLKVEEPNRRYLLYCKDSGQDDIVIETNHQWQEGDTKVVKVVKVDGEGRIKAAQFS